MSTYLQNKNSLVVSSPGTVVVVVDHKSHRFCDPRTQPERLLLDRKKFITIEGSDVFAAVNLSGTYRGRPVHTALVLSDYHTLRSVNCEDGRSRLQEGGDLGWLVEQIDDQFTTSMASGERTASTYVMLSGDWGAVMVSSEPGRRTERFRLEQRPGVGEEFCRGIITGGQGQVAVRQNVRETAAAMEGDPGVLHYHLNRSNVLQALRHEHGSRSQYEITVVDEDTISIAMQHTRHHRSKLMFEEDTLRVMGDLPSGMVKFVPGVGIERLRSAWGEPDVVRETRDWPHSANQGTGTR